MELTKNSIFSGHGNLIILSGAAIAAFAAFWGSKINSNDQALADKVIIQSLNDTIITKDNENKIIQNKIVNMQIELEDIACETKENTETTQKLLKEVEDLTIINHKIANTIKNEQREKGKFELILPYRKVYSFLIGSNTFNLSREYLEEGYNLDSRVEGVNITLRLVGDKLLITTKISDRDNTLLVDIINNEWALKKVNLFSVNHDSKGLEVLNSKGLVALQVDFKDEEFIIKIIDYRDNIVFIVNEKGISFLQYTRPDFAKEFSKLTHHVDSKFLHHGENYLGKRKD